METNALSNADDDWALQIDDANWASSNSPIKSNPKNYLNMSSQQGDTSEVPYEPVSVRQKLRNDLFNKILDNAQKTRFDKDKNSNDDATEEIKKLYNNLNSNPKKNKSIHEYNSENTNKQNQSLNTDKILNNKGQANVNDSNNNTKIAIGSKTSTRQNSQRQMLNNNYYNEDTISSSIGNDVSYSEDENQTKNADNIYEAIKMISVSLDNVNKALTIISKAFDPLYNNQYEIITNLNKLTDNIDTTVNGNINKNEMNEIKLCINSINENINMLNNNFNRSNIEEIVNNKLKEKMSNYCYIPESVLTALVSKVGNCHANLPNDYRYSVGNQPFISTYRDSNLTNAYHEQMYSQFNNGNSKNYANKYGDKEYIQGGLDNIFSYTNHNSIISGEFLDNDYNCNANNKDLLKAQNNNHNNFDPDIINLRVNKSQSNNYNTTKTISAVSAPNMKKNFNNNYNMNLISISKKNESMQNKLLDMQKQFIKNNAELHIRNDKSILTAKKKVQKTIKLDNNDVDKILLDSIESKQNDSDGTNFVYSDRYNITNEYSDNLM